MTFMLRSKSDSGRKSSRTGSLSQLHNWDGTYRYFSLFTELSPYHCLRLPNCRVSISELMVTCLNDIMVNTHNERGDPQLAHPNRNWSPPPTLAPAIASILESRDEQTELLLQLVATLTLTLLVAAMGRGMLLLQHRLATVTLWSLTRRSSPRQESLSRPITGFG
jgi:hypothetical protein